MPTAASTLAPTGSHLLTEVSILHTSALYIMYRLTVFQDIDVWLDVCYHSNLAPPRYSSDLHPEYLIAGAGHHWDSYGIKDIPAEPQFIQQAHLWEIKTVQKWLRSRALGSS